MPDKDQVGGESRGREEEEEAVKRTRMVAAREKMVIWSIMRVYGGEGAFVFEALGWLVGGWVFFRD